MCCRAPRSAYGPTEAGKVGQLILPGRGVFVVQCDGGRVVVDATTAIIIDAGQEYSVSHPTDGGDDCTVLVLPPELREESFSVSAGRSSSPMARSS